jgi:uncharacterized protein (TIGR02757 family)
MALTRQELFGFLEEKYHQYNIPDFIPADPVSVPHRFSRKEDIEIAGFLTAVISWGNRASIVKDATRLADMMGCSPYDFIINLDEQDVDPFLQFYHRTFNGVDCLFFLESLKNIYLNHGGLESCFQKANHIGVRESISRTRKIFLETAHEKRSEKHFPDPISGSSCKRINMFLRWMVRDDNRGVDFGLWKKVSPAELMCPLDVHSGNVARKLGLVKRNQNDWKAVEELTGNLQSFDASDPVKYDFALFGLGIFEKF